jgi:S-DNA-T family DNA segregation ATPase FtsK/SpoIIIE
MARRRTRSYSRTPERSEKPRRSKASPLLPWTWKPMPHERKVDLIAGILIVFGLLIFISMITGRPGSFTEPVSNLFKQIAGIGAFLLPLIIFFIGLWLILRRSSKLPKLSTGRLVGIILLTLNLFTFLYVFTAPWYGSRISGYIGMLGGPLTRAFGTPGTIVVLLAWLFIALALTFDISVPDIFRRMVEGFRKRRAARVRPQAHAPVPPFTTTADGRDATGVVSELPSDFNPLRTPRQPWQPPIKPLVRTEEKPIRVAGKPSAAQHPSQAAAEEKPARRAPSPWKLPAIADILDPVTEVVLKAGMDQERARLIEETLASFSAPARVVDIQRGPTVTLFGVEPEFVEGRQGRVRVRVSQITRLENDLALALAAPRIRIQAPVPGKGYVGIEVPNTEISLVSLREVLESDAFRRVRSPLRLALGKDVSGHSIVADLVNMPHLLIAGTTGSGKSVCVNSILSCLLMNNDPSTLRLMLVDPKRVELTGYNSIPHLIAPVVTEMEKVIGALRWVGGEMDARYKKFYENGVRNIQEYNRSGNDPLPNLVVVIDELADLMMLAPDETERSLTRLAQLARATGIHLIIATQRPSVNVVTGLIKANFPARIAFMVASNTDSRVILDQPGAERLLGRGDMLYQAPEAPAPVRLQGTFVSDGEILRLVEYWRAQALPGEAAAGALAPVELLPVGLPMKQKALWDSGEVSLEDPLLKEAIEIVRRERKASISMLQRKMRIGYTRSARIIDALEEQGIISAATSNSQVREVLDYGSSGEIKTE